MVSVSVLIVSWNGREALRRCLQSLDAGGFEVIVVDNASSDGSSDMVEAEFPAVRLLRQAVNLGFAGGVNLAARLASSRFFLLLNPDASAGCGSVETLARFMDRKQECGAAAGRLVDADGRFQRGWNVRRFPTLASLAADLLLIDEVWPSNPATRRYRASDLDDTRATEVEQPAAACLMVKREAFEAIGGMDERFHPAWFEDVDFCRRLKAGGWQVWFVPEAGFLHEGGHAMRALGPARFHSIYYRNLRHYAAKHHGRIFARAVDALIVAGMLERIVVLSACGRRAAAAGCASVIRETLARRKA